MPDFSLLWAQPFQITIHALLALTALGLGIVQLAMPKGTQIHRIIGYSWALLMAGTALTALFIHEIRMWGSFSAIHLLIPITLFSLWTGIQQARRGNIERHRKIMLMLFFLALLVTGFFTLFPGRVMHAVFFGTA